MTPSTGNVFRDLGFSTAEAEHLLVRADLFSTDTLIDMLARLGVGVRLVVKP